MGRNRRIAWSLVAVVAAALAVSGFADDTSSDYAAEAFKRALVTFAVARTLNGVISVAQGTEVAVEPGGVGVNFTVGQILDPINDLIEQFSSVMLVAATSLGLQTVLLKISSWWGLTAVVVASALLALAALWWPSPDNTRTTTFFVRIFVITLFLRFAVPVLIIGTNVVFDTFLATEQAAATAALETTSSEIEDLNDQPPVVPDASAGFMDRLGAIIDDSLASMNVSERLKRLRALASNAAEHIVSLIVIFVLQTIILPLAFLWLFLETLKAAVSRAARL